MRKADIARMSLADRIGYGFRGGDRPVFLAPANKGVFLFMCRVSFGLAPPRSKRLWALYCFVRDGDSIGFDPKSCDLVRAHVPEFAKSSDAHIKKALEQLAGWGLLYEATSTVLPTGPLDDSRKSS